MAQSCSLSRCPSCRQFTVECRLAPGEWEYSSDEGYHGLPDRWVHRCLNSGCGYFELWEMPDEVLDCPGDHETESQPPPQPVRVDPAWLTWNGGCVVALAREIQQKRDAAALPVLADALEDAGCADPRLLGPCRAGTFPEAQEVLNRLLGG